MAPTSMAGINATSPIDDGANGVHTRFYARKVVRDLLWTFTSPHLIAATHFPVLPTALVGVDAVQHHPRVVAWLAALEADPSDLIAFLEDATSVRGKKLALGVYFAALLEFWLRFCPLFHVERFARSKQIVASSGQTVGQLKFLLRLSQASDDSDANSSSSVAISPHCDDLHVESSVKFFLLHDVGSATSKEPAPFALEHFIGPHLGENLAWRVQEVERKLSLCRGTSVQHWLSTQYSDTVTSFVVLRGYLFYPLALFMCTADVTHHHDWSFHRTCIEPENKRASFKTDSRIASDHLRGWWTANVVNDLRAKVLANRTYGLGESRFVVLPKLHWLAPVLAIEEDDASTPVIPGDAALGLAPLALLTLDALEAVAQAHFVRSDAVVMPLLIAELVNCRPINAALDKGRTKWKELSRGFALDAASWDPLPLVDDAVRYRRTTAGDAERQYDGQRPSTVDGVVKPTDAERQALRQRPHQHAFDAPATITPSQVVEELLLVMHTNRVVVPHAQLIASVRLLLEQQQPVAAAAFVLQCLQCVVDASAVETTQLKTAHRVGHLIVDAFVAVSNTSEQQEQQATATATTTTAAAAGDLYSAYRQFVLDVVRDRCRWSFLFLLLRASDVVIHAAMLCNKEDDDNSGAIDTAVETLLEVRDPRWNTIAVEMVSVFVLRSRCSTAAAESSSSVIDNVFARLVGQSDWRNAEQLALASRDKRLQQQLIAAYSDRNLSKALKRLQRALASDGQQDASSPFTQHVSASQHPTGPPIDHLTNRRLYAPTDDTKPSIVLVDTPPHVTAMLAMLEHYETVEINDADTNALLKRVVVGLDCEWRPQIFTNDTHDMNNNEGLSLYQLAIGTHVFVVDVQALGATAASTPLAFVWLRCSSFAIVGFGVQSDLQRIQKSFPGLLSSSDNSKRLVELKQLAAYRQLPVAHWGLAQLALVCLEKAVDKTQQCSDWSKRPLTQQQVLYAANDAVAVRRIALHLLIDVVCGEETAQTPAAIVAFVQPFAVGLSVMLSMRAPLGLVDVRVALERLELLGSTTFHTLGHASNEDHDLSSSSSNRSKKQIALPRGGVVVKTIAVVATRRSPSIDSCNEKKDEDAVFAAVVVALDRSIDMQVLAQVLGVAGADDVALADRDTLLRIFGYARGGVGPIGLREQQRIRVVLDEYLLSAHRLLCGAGAVDHVYALAPNVLVDAVQAVVASVSQ